MQPHGRWWREWEVWLLAVVVGAIYLTRLGEPPCGGEESARGQIAREMAQGNDWVVPRLQGAPVLAYYPPMHNWLIALVAVARGSLDEVTIRFPSAVAVLLLVFLLYGYSRTFLSRLGAFAAAAAFATTGHVLQLGRLGETDALFMLFASGALLVWRWADVRGKPALVGWCAGYTLVALGMLTKGAQAPVYFAGGVGGYLLLTRRWRILLQWPHFVGIALFVVLCAAWEIPYFFRAGADDSWVMLSTHFTSRVGAFNWPAFCKHFAIFPLEVAAGMLPWSILLLAYVWRGFRRTIGPAREHLWFLVCPIGVALLSCWLLPGGRNRHFAAIYPCFAPLIGLVVQRCCEALAAIPRPANLWTRYLRAMGVIMPVVGVWVATATALGWGPSRGAQPPAFAAAYLLAAAALGVLAIAASRSSRPSYHRLGILSITVFLGLSVTGVMHNVYFALREPIAENIGELKQRLPQDSPLVSVGLVDSNFVFYYGAPIRPLSPGELAGRTPSDWTYCCVNGEPSQLGSRFPHEVIAVISCKGIRSSSPKNVVTVARRLTASQR